MFELRVPSVGLGVEWNDTVWWGVGVGGVCVFLLGLLTRPLLAGIDRPPPWMIPDNPG